MPIVLITGFGPFGDVRDNPSARIAQAVDGRVVRGLRIAGRVLPVAYAEGPAAAIATAQRLGAVLVLGFGRHPHTSVPRVEIVGANAGSGADILGREVPVLDHEGPRQARTNVDAPALAAALGGIVTEDAGLYVCNAWIYRVSRALAATRQVGFVHVPPAGLDPERVLAAIGALWGRDEVLPTEMSAF